MVRTENIHLNGQKTVLQGYCTLRKNAGIENNSSNPIIMIFKAINIIVLGATENMKTQIDHSALLE